MTIEIGGCLPTSRNAFWASAGSGVASANAAAAMTHNLTREFLDSMVSSWGRLCASGLANGRSRYPPRDLHAVSRVDLRGCVVRLQLLRDAREKASLEH